jgi:hypothetical protein
MPRIPLTLKLLTLGLTIYGCGQVDEQGDDHFYDFEYHQSPEALQDYVKNTKIVACIEGSKCPESVGLLVVAHPDQFKSSRCTGSLIGSNLFLTNLHCLPDTSSQSCAKNVFIHLPATNNGEYEIFGCHRIVATSERAKKERNSELDYAIIELDTHSNRKELNVRLTGIEHNESLTAWVGTISKTKSVVEIQPRKLKNIQGSFFVANKDENFSEVVTLSGEEIIPGNSGSPVLDENGSAVAVLQSILGPGLYEHIKLKTPTYFSFATNLSCVPELFSDARLVSKECLKTFPFEAKEKITSENSKKLYQDLMKEFESKLTQDAKNHYFKWVVKYLPDERNSKRSLLSMTFTPSCVFEAPKPGTEFEIPVFDLIVELNADAQSPIFNYKETTPDGRESFKVKLIATEAMYSVFTVYRITIERKNNQGEATEETLTVKACLS